MDKRHLSKLRKVADKVVRHANRPGGPLDKGEFTMGMARGEICDEMGFEPGELDSKEWKKVVKGIVEEVLETVGEESTQATSQKPESFKSKASKEKPRDKSPATDSVQTESEEEDKETKSSSKTSKSREKKPSFNDSPTKPSSKRSEGKASKRKHDSKVEEPSERGKKSSKKSSPGDESVNAVSDEERGDKSESEMSSLYDIDPAPKKRKSKKSGSDDESAKAKGKEKPPKRDPLEGLSPEEVKVVELKKIVVACGVRKQWSKEFADIDSPRDQRRHLESILSELGMKGAPTIGKAKALKEKRELAAELNDVREFEAARGVSGGRSSRSKVKQQDDSDEEEEEEEEEEGEPPKSKSALAAVMDFLGGESDSD